MEATYYDNIMEQQRLEPEFFRVGFYGRKFPFFLRVSWTYIKYDKVTRLRVAVKALHFCCGDICHSSRFLCLHKQKQLSGWRMWSIGNILRNRDQKFDSWLCVFLTICRCSTTCLYIKQNAVLQQCWVITQLIFIILNYHALKSLTWQNDSNTRLMTLLCHLQVKISSLFNR